MSKYLLTSNRKDFKEHEFKSRKKANKALSKFLYDRDLQVSYTREAKHVQEFVCENGSFFSVSRVLA